MDASFPYNSIQDFFSNEPFQLVDHSNQQLFFEPPLQRVVSLVPSNTETIFALGAQERLVARTRYCIHPDPEVRNVEKVGGTKDPDLERIIELAPDLVLANQEENRKQDILALREAGIKVHVDEPQTPDDALRMVAFYGRLFGLNEQAFQIVLTGEKVLHQLEQDLQEQEAANALRLRPKPKPRVLVLIWREPWMAAGSQTYIGSMIETLGGVHLLKEASERYPTLQPQDFETLAPSHILLPSEPYTFTVEHIQELKKLCPQIPAASEDGIRLCNGEDLMWFGARTPQALFRLRSLFLS